MGIKSYLTKLALTIGVTVGILPFFVALLFGFACIGILKLAANPNPQHLS